MSGSQQQLLARGQRSNSGTHSDAHLSLSEWEYTDQQLGGRERGREEGGRRKGERK